MTDQQLLIDYARHGSEAAFAELVGRHKDWVYSVCLRGTGNAALAEDAAQAVLIAMARKSKSLSRHPTVTGWLYRSARYAAGDALKLERRRMERETEVAKMNRDAGAQDTRWEELAPRLEPALDELPESYRVPILLRFYQKKTHAEIAKALEVSEVAVEKRVSRGLERLGKLLSRRGVTMPAAVVGGLMLAHGVSAAPASVGVGAGVAAVVGGVGGVSGTKTMILTKGILQMGMMMKVGVTAAVAVGLLGITAVVMHMGAGQPTDAKGPTVAVSERAVAPGVNGTTTAPAPKLLSVELAKGCTLDLLGLTVIAEKDPGWWAPDGTRLENPDFAKDSGMPEEMRKEAWKAAQNIGSTSMQFAMRLNVDRPKDAEPMDISFAWETYDSAVKDVPTGRVRVTSSSSMILPDAPGERVMMMMLSGQPKTATFRYRLAAEPFKTLFTLPVTGGSGQGAGVSVVLTPSTDKDGNTSAAMEVTSSLADRAQLVAVGIDGKTYREEISELSVKEGPTGTVQVIRSTVRLPLAKIREFAYQTRPFGKWLEIRNISLEAGQITTPEIVKDVEDPKPAGNPGLLP